MYLYIYIMYIYIYIYILYYIYIILYICYIRCIHIYIYIMYILYIYIYIFTSTHTFYLQQYPHFVDPWALAAGQGPRCFAMGTARVKKAPATPKRRKSSEAAKVKAKRPAASPQTGPQDADGAAGFLVLGRML